jgi:hypothetical protein
MWRDHGAQWKLLPLHELRVDERVFLINYEALLGG